MCTFSTPSAAQWGCSIEKKDDAGAETINRTAEAKLASQIPGSGWGVLAAAPRPTSSSVAVPPPRPPSLLPAGQRPPAVRGPDRLPCSPAIPSQTAKGASHPPGITTSRTAPSLLQVPTLSSACDVSRASNRSSRQEFTGGRIVRRSVGVGVRVRETKAAVPLIGKPHFCRVALTFAPLLLAVAPRTADRRPALSWLGGPSASDRMSGPRPRLCGHRRNRLEPSRSQACASGRVAIVAQNSRAEVRRSFVTTTVRDESQVTPQGRHQ